MIPIRSHWIRLLRYFVFFSHYDVHSAIPCQITGRDGIYLADSSVFSRSMWCAQNPQIIYGNFWSSVGGRFWVYLRNPVIQTPSSTITMSAVTALYPICEQGIHSKASENFTVFFVGCKTYSRSILQLGAPMKQDCYESNPVSCSRAQFQEKNGAEIWGFQHLFSASTPEAGVGNKFGDECLFENMRCENKSTSDRWSHAVIEAGMTRDTTCRDQPKTRRNITFLIKQQEFNLGKCVINVIVLCVMITACSLPLEKLHLCGAWII